MDVVEIVDKSQNQGDVDAERDEDLYMEEMQEALDVQPLLARSEMSSDLVKRLNASSEAQLNGNESGVGQKRGRTTVQILDLGEPISTQSLSMFIDID